MHVNEGYLINILPLTPLGINSTMFTECCSAAICEDELCCPICKRKVIGHNAESDAERGRIRWKSATCHWNRGKEDK